MFAIITFRHEGPIKSWQAVRATNVHNARTKPLAHAMPGAPPPKHLIGTGNLERDVKRLLRGAKLDPDNLRKNGVIAYEAILSASSAFFDEGTPEERAARLKQWTAAQVQWAKERYKSFRIASMVLHVDEKTPHIHLVVLPLEVKPDKRCRDEKAMRWGLVGRTISGPGKFDEAQDAYAAAMQGMGLIRGVKGSGRKHEPVPVYLKRMAAKEQAVDAAKTQLELDLAGVAADRGKNDRDRVALAAGFAELARAAAASRVELDRLVADRDAFYADASAERRQREAERAALEKSKAEHAAKVLEDQKRIAADREALHRQLAQALSMEAELNRDIAQQRKEAAAAARALEAAADLQAEAEADRAAAAADRAAAAAERAAVRDMGEKLNAHRDRLLPTLRAARDFRLQVATLKGQALTPVASSTRAAVDALSRAASDAHVPPGETRPDVVAMYDRIRRQGAAIR